MDKPIPVFKMVIDPEKENSGVDYIALVDAPAIQVNWFAFENHLKFKADTERKIIVAPAMIPNMKIYRRTKEMGEFYVVFDKEQIDIIQEKFMDKLFINNINEMHDPKKKLDGIFMKNSWVSDESMGIKAPEMFSDLPDGTWFISYKFKDDSRWQEFVKSGEFHGVSVEGMFDMVPVRDDFESKLEKFIAEITQD